MGLIMRTLLLSKWKKVAIADKLRLNSQKSVTGVMQILAVPYIKDENEAHTVNFYYPQATTNLLPTIIDIHGGGWTYGDSNLNRNRNIFLSKQGFAVVAINYRLLPKTNLQGQISDIFNFFHWFSKNASQYRCDTGNVFITGDSAGGHLAALTLCCNSSEGLQKAYGVKKLSFEIKAAALSHAVCNINDLGFGKKGFMARAIQKEMMSMMFGRSLNASPIYKNASINEISQALSLPQIMLISSEADELHFQSLMLAQCLPNAKTYFWKKDDGGGKLTHVFHILYPQLPESEQTNTAMATFFKENIATQAKPRKIIATK